MKIRNGRKIIFNIANSYEEAEEFAIKEELSLTPEERLDIMQSLREDGFLIKNASRKRLRRFPEVVRGKKG